MAGRGYLGPGPGVPIARPATGEQHRGTCCLGAAKRTVALAAHDPVSVRRFGEFANELQVQYLHLKQQLAAANPASRAASTAGKRALVRQLVGR